MNIAQEAMSAGHTWPARHARSRADLARSLSLAANNLDADHAAPAAAAAASPGEAPEHHEAMSWREGRRKGRR